MLTYGLVVEGYYDDVALREFLHNSTAHSIEPVVRACGSKEKLMKRFPGFLEEFRHIKKGSNVDKALVIRDADNKDPQELINKMTMRISNRSYPFLVKPLIIVQQLEAWLLADESAISQITGRVERTTQEPENVTNPKDVLKHILSKAGITYTVEVARKIAAKASVKVIESRCPSFKRFCEAVHDC